MPTVPPPQGAAIAAGTLARAARRWRHLVIALGIGCLGWCAAPGLANQLPKADVRAEMDRAKAEGRGDYRFPHRLASGELVMVEVHSTPTVIDGRSLLLSVLLPESRTILQQQELQRDQTWLEALVAERTAQAIRAEAERSRMLAWSLTGALAAVVALSLAVALLRRGARRQRELDDELQDVLRGARLGRMRWDLVRNTISLGPRLRRQLGLDEHTPQDIPAQTWQQWLHPDDAPQVQRVLQAHLKGDSEVADLRVRVQHRAGHWIWLQAWWRVVARDPATGRATMIAGVLRDVSDEVALAQSRAIAASVFEDAGEAIIVTDERGTVLEVNSALLQMGGYTRDELIGRADLPWRPADRHGMPSWH
ncbi:MAG: PAS domain-containing protein, partial [Tepidimonas sp.]|uniref:PAS domain-containing protein n=1 Tax=Tepidimonas sp. TaxID=2002775 RepID=UPI004054C919